ncbi:MAG: 2,3-bisphosphoglycerate-independent phosphoglycerate mutase [Candidatus Parcubacteria bacterium]|nr:MAG: 2,3-bisphosphoglycerate-independent phosphoglycerate mutase [Candidatus Parcubacteria bacterium]
MRKIALIILDGWGVGKENFSNPIHIAKKDFLVYLQNHYPYSLLQASGIAVGLPWEEEGNSEVGHLTMGTGRVYYQSYPKITLSIKNESFFENKTLKLLIEYCNKFSSNLHFIGLLTSGIIHAAFEHLVALLEFCSRNNFNRVYLHLFLDGRDSQPKSGVDLLKRLLHEMQAKKVGKIATLCGRTYGMDKNEYWQIKTEVAFYLINEGKGKKIDDPIKYLSNIYITNSDFNDENLEPLVIDENGIVKDNDAIFFFNFREDGIYQLSRAFIDPEFSFFPRPIKKNILIASMVKYFEDIDYLVAFEKDKITTSLSKVISENNLTQLKIAEKVKAYHLTYYFNGLFKDPHPNEFWKILPSSQKSIFENPLINSEEITNILINAINENIYDFIAVNYAAPDIVAHTGNINLAIQVVEKIDFYLRKVYEKIIEKDYFLIITSDHGNLEQMIDIQTGEAETSHNINPVPFYLVNKNLYLENKNYDLKRKEKEIIGTLIDIAPTILEILNLPIPQEMEGVSLIKKFNW